LTIQERGNTESLCKAAGGLTDLFEFIKETAVPETTLFKGEIIFSFGLARNSSFEPTVAELHNSKLSAASLCG
jgi:hypothetical protein